MEELQQEHSVRARRASKRLIIIASVCIVLVAVSAVGIYMSGRTDAPSASYPLALTQSAQNFTVLYYENTLPLGFTINPSAVSYHDGILFIPVTAGDGRQVVITEQALPETFSKSNDIIGSENIDGADGQAALSHVEGRTTATMISKDRKTMVIINDVSGVGSSAVKDLLRSLKPVDL